MLPNFPANLTPSLPRDAEERARYDQMKAELTALWTENRDLRKEITELEKARDEFAIVKARCTLYGNYCSITEEERVKRAGKPKSS